MTKKIIIAILIILIIVSLGIIGYVIISQNPNVNLARFWPIGSTADNQTPKVPANFFPEATTTTNSLLNPTRAPNTTSASTSSPDNFVSDNPNLAGRSALGLALVNNNKKERVLFIDRASGNLYEITDQNELVRLTNETISNIGEIYWGQDKAGERVILRLPALPAQAGQAGQITNLSGLIKPSATSTDLGKLTSQTLSPDIRALAVAPDGTKFFTLETSANGIIGFLNDWSGKNKKKIWSFAFGDWQATWPKANIISLQTRPSASDSGYLYFLDPATGKFTKIISGIAGLTTKISPDGQKIIFSRSNLGQFGLYLHDVASQKTSSPGVNTLPEKCTWGDNNTLYCAVPRAIPTGLYPDNWYQGKITFTDDVWKIDLAQKTTALIFPLKGNYDLVNLVLAPKRGWLYAINKPDNSIQSFSLPTE